MVVTVGGSGIDCSSLACHRFRYLGDLICSLTLFPVSEKCWVVCLGDFEGAEGEEVGHSESSEEKNMSVSCSISRQAVSGLLSHVERTRPLASEIVDSGKLVVMAGHDHGCYSSLRSVDPGKAHLASWYLALMLRLANDGHLLSVWLPNEHHCVLSAAGAAFAQLVMELHSLHNGLVFPLNTSVLDRSPKPENDSMVLEI
jgi:hypothetical protein